MVAFRSDGVPAEQQITSAWWSTRPVRTLMGALWLGIRPIRGLRWVIAAAAASLRRPYEQ